MNNDIVTWLRGHNIETRAALLLPRDIHHCLHAIVCYMYSYFLPLSKEWHWPIRSPYASLCNLLTLCIMLVLIAI